MIPKTCKNCQHEIKGGKFCIDCGFPIEEAKDKGDMILEKLDAIDKRTAKLEAAEDARETAKQKFIAERKEKHGKDTKNSDSGNTGIGKSGSILDIF